jgi:hypothetical protein
MESLILEPKFDTPQVKMSEEDGKMEISGKSLPEDAASFYKPILSWLNKYATRAKPSTEFTFKLSYFNTASSKLILDIMMILEKIHNEGKEVCVNWNYNINDEDMKEAGEEYSELVDVHFNHISYTA